MPPAVSTSTTALSRASTLTSMEAASCRAPRSALVRGAVGASSLRPQACIGRGQRVDEVLRPRRQTTRGTPQATCRRSIADNTHLNIVGHSDKHIRCCSDRRHGYALGCPGPLWPIQLRIQLSVDRRTISWHDGEPRVLGGSKLGACARGRLFAPPLGQAAAGHGINPDLLLFGFKALIRLGQQGNRA